MKITILFFIIPNSNFLNKNVPQKFAGNPLKNKISSTVLVLNNSCNFYLKRKRKTLNPKNNC